MTSEISNNAINNTLQNMNPMNQVSGNIAGNVTSNMTGNVYGNVAGNMTGNNSIGNNVANAINNIGNQIQHTANNAATALISHTYLLTLFLFLMCLALIMFYFLSYSFRVSKTISNMKIYSNFQAISSSDSKAIQNFKLANFYVASSFNSAHSGFQLLDYVSLEMVIANLRAGARFLEFTIFNDKYGKDGGPVVSNGYQEGEWKLMANHLTFEDVCATIRENAFTVANESGGVYNSKDPLFISLNLKTNYQVSTLDKIHKILLKNFRNRMLSNEYSYSKRNLGNIKLKDLMGKVVIFATDGFQGSDLEELINYNWAGDDIRRIYASDLEAENGLIQHNRTKLSMVYPHQEGVIWSVNYEPKEAWKKGCQFVAMNYQKVDSGMNHYIEKFRNKSFVLKPPNLR